jgi:hypothetical protein
MQPNFEVNPFLCIQRKITHSSKTLVPLIQATEQKSKAHY